MRATPGVALVGLWAVREEDIVRALGHSLMENG